MAAETETHRFKMPVVPFSRRFVTHFLRRTAGFAMQKGVPIGVVQISNKNMAHSTEIVYNAFGVANRYGKHRTASDPTDTTERVMRIRRLGRGESPLLNDIGG